MYRAAVMGSDISILTFLRPPDEVLVPTILVTEPLRPTSSLGMPSSSLVTLLIWADLPLRYPATVGRAPLGSTSPKDTTDPRGTLAVRVNET